MADRPDAEALLNETMRVVERELGKYKRQTSTRPISTWDAQAITGYGRFLIQAAKHQAKSDDEDLENLTDEELEAEAQRILGEAKGK